MKTPFTSNIQLLDNDLQSGGRFSIYRYLAQSALAGLFLVVFIFSLDALGHGVFDDSAPKLSPLVISSSIASTIFLIFGAPGIPTARTRAVIGGQLIGILSGLIALSICRILYQPDFDPLLFGIGISMPLSLFLMTILDAEHPPAAGTAVAFSMMYKNIDNIVWLVLFIIIAVICLSLIRSKFYVRDGLKALKGMDKTALDTLKKNKIMTITDLNRSTPEKLTKLFADNAKYYSGSFPIWIEQAGDKELIRKTNQVWKLKDLF